MILIQVRNHLLKTFQSNFFCNSTEGRAHKALGIEVGLRLGCRVRSWGRFAAKVEIVFSCFCMYASDLEGLCRHPVVRKCRHISKFIWIGFTWIQLPTALLERPGEHRIKIWRRVSLIFWKGEPCDAPLLYIYMYWWYITFFFSALFLLKSIMEICHPFVSSCI